eukprot:636899-Prymnesium_polylepis.1
MRRRLEIEVDMREIGIGDSQSSILVCSKSVDDVALEPAVQLEPLEEDGQLFECVPNLSSRWMVIWQLARRWATFGGRWRKIAADAARRWRSIPHDARDSPSSSACCRRLRPTKVSAQGVWRSATLATSRSSWMASGACRNATPFTSQAASTTSRSVHSSFACHASSRAHPPAASIVNGRCGFRADTTESNESE